VTLAIPLLRFIDTKGGDSLFEMGQHVLLWLPFPSHTLFSLPCPSFPSHPLPSLPLEVGPLNPTRGLGQRCKLPQRGLGIRNRIRSILASKSHIWWQEVY